MSFLTNSDIFWCIFCCSTYLLVFTETYLYNIYIHTLYFCIVTLLLVFLMQGCRNFVRAHAQIVCKEILVPKSTSPRLLAIPAIDLIAGLYNRHLNSDRGYAYTNDLEVRLKALNDLAKE